ncbi:hypothetical protein CapIbe_021143 [Capra ibex]
MGGAAAPPGDQAGPLRLQVEMPVWALAQLQPCGAGTRTGRVCATPRGRQLHVSAFVPEVIARLGAVLWRLMLEMFRGGCRKKRIYPGLSLTSASGHMNE